MNGKNRLHLVLLTWAMLISTAGGLRAQMNLNITNWSPKAGIRPALIHSMVRDSTGMVWLGTWGEGLGRFDGKNFKFYLKGQPQCPLPSNEVNNLIEDSLRRIWIGTKDGLVIYDPATGRFRKIEFQGIEKKSYRTVTPFWSTSREVLCLLDSAGIFAVNIRTWGARKVTSILPADTKGDGPRVRSTIYDSVTECIWFNSYKALLRVSLKDDRVDSFHVPGIPTCMSFDKVHRQIWVGGSEGLFRYDLSDLVCHDVPRVNGTFKNKYFNEVTSILFGNDGRIWMYVSRYLGSGYMYVYEPRTGSLEKLAYTANRANVISPSTNGAFYEDREGIIWASKYDFAGSFDRIMRHPTNTAYFPIPFGLVNLVEKGEGSKLWVGTSDGLMMTDISNGTTIVLDQPEDYLSDVSPGMNALRAIFSIEIDTTLRKLWTGGFKSAHVVDTRTGKMSKVTFLDSAGHPFNIRPGLCSILYQEKDAVVVHLNDHLFRLRKDGLVAEQILYIGKYCKIQAHQVTTPLPSGERLAFVKTNTERRMSFKVRGGDWVPVTSSLDSIDWQSIILDARDGTLWTATTTEVIHLDARFRPLRSWGTANGLTGRSIFKLLQDHDGRIWVKSTNHLEYLPHPDGNFVSAPEEINILFENLFEQTAVNFDSEGSLYIGKWGGYERISFDRLVRPSPPRLYLDSILIAGKQGSSGEWVGNIVHLTLEHDQNNISLQAGIIDQHFNAGSSISYRLLPLDTTFHDVPPDYPLRFDNIATGVNTLQMYARNGAGVSSPWMKNIVIDIQPAFWNTWWFRLSGLLAISGVIYAFMRYRWSQRMRLHRIQAENERQVLALRQRATDLELQALRAQMNPHFIFNCLNSINRFILMNEPQAAADYLTKFSRLIRMVLNNSRQESITVEEELETLTLFLDMEKLRFNDAFNYTLHCPEEVEPDAIYIPPLLLQPFAENAVWHGLMHKKENGRLSIEVGRSNGHLVCVLTDDGVGREKAEEYRSKSSDKNKSHGMQLTMERLSLWNHGHPGGHDLNIEDLKDGARASGTRVTLMIRYETSPRKTNHGDPQIPIPS